jgi:hypothetical protein
VIELDEKYKKAALEDLESGGKRLRASVGILLKRAGDISKKITLLIQKDIKGELEKSYTEAISQAQAKGTKIAKELTSFDAAYKKAQYQGGKAKSLFAEYNLVLSENEIKVIAVGGTAFTADTLSTVLK